jgi:two-component system NtrC family sensor kinase
MSPQGSSREPPCSGAPPPSDRLQPESARQLVGMTLLAAGAARDLKGPLNYLLANLEFLDAELLRHESDLAPGRVQDLRDCLREAIAGAQHIRAVVREIPEGVARAPGQVDLHELLFSCIKVTRTETEHRARVVTEFDAVPTLPGSSSQLGRVFQNLLVNAAQAVAGDPGSEAYIRVTTRSGPGRHVTVEIADSGPGIAPEHLERVFDPFFTTKAAGEGTGLGLSICRQIVADMGGTIVAESPPGRGAVFRLTLPLDAERPAGSEASARFTPSEPPRRRLPLRQPG